MKTQNETQVEIKKAELISWRKNLSMLAIGALAALVTSACGNKSTSGQATAVPPIGAFNTCAGCVGGVGGVNQVFGSALGKAFAYSLNAPYLELGLDFVNTGNGVAASAQGRLVVTIPQATCAVQAGAYSVTTTKVGNWANDGQSFFDMYLTATGPSGVVQIYIPSAYLIGTNPAVISAENRAYSFRIQGGIQVKGQNSGYACSFVMAE
jgi:hypothetical protein